MALRGLANADELLLLKCKTEMLYHFNEVSDRYSRFADAIEATAFTKKQMKRQASP